MRKIDKVKGALAAAISVAAMYVASTASSMCGIWWFEDVEMPESLYKRD
ncbi:cyclic lactone autoinducer peptide [Inconstantimicrobium porci]|nr:cyclic lactone autoinducer peptide [Inconstantimicrobium porci]MDD6769631.1 cyclic lactone autoinducer peptide [Inconstantimicrobium porci]